MRIPGRLSGLGQLPELFVFPLRRLRTARSPVLAPQLDESPCRLPGNCICVFATVHVDLGCLGLELTRTQDNAPLVCCSGTVDTQTSCYQISPIRVRIRPNGAVGELFKHGFYSRSYRSCRFPHRANAHVLSRFSARGFFHDRTHRSVIYHVHDAWKLGGTAHDHRAARGRASQSAHNPPNPAFPFFSFPGPLRASRGSATLLVPRPCMPSLGASPRRAVKHWRALSGSRSTAVRS